MPWNPNIPTVTNRVQDDLEAIRENFQVLDGHLADTNNPHQVTAAQVGAPTQAAFDAHVADTNNPHNVQAQQVPYSSDVSGFTPATVKAALDALAGVRIIEMGSNSNGEYVQWENGLQVCWRKITGLTTTNIQGNIYGSLSQSWTYPAAFTSAPSVLVAAERTSASGTGIGWGTFASVPGATSASSLVLASSHSTFEGNLVLFAIGRWK